MTSLVVISLLLTVPLPQECELPETRDVAGLKTYAQKCGTLSVALDSVATWCFDSSGAWTGGQRPDGRKPRPIDPHAPPIGDCARALSSCDEAKASITDELPKLLANALSDLERPYRAQRYPPKRSGLNERPSPTVTCGERSRPELFSQAQARMDLARLASAVQNEYANYKTWLFARSLECSQQVRSARVDATRVAVSVDAPRTGLDAGAPVSTLASGPPAPTAIDAGLVGPATTGSLATVTSTPVAGGAGVGPRSAAIDAGLVGPATTGSLATVTPAPVAGGGGASGPRSAAVSGSLAGASADGGLTPTSASVSDAMAGGGRAGGPLVGAPNVPASLAIGTAGGNEPSVAGARWSPGVSGGLPGVMDSGSGLSVGAVSSAPGSAAVPSSPTSLLETWRELAAQRGKMELDRDYTLGFLASRELRDCRCQRSSPAGIVSRLETSDGVPQLDADSPRAVACERCLQNAFAAWKARVSKQCALMSDLSPFELEVLQKSDDGNGLPPRCWEKTVERRGLDAGVLLGNAPVRTQASPAGAPTTLSVLLPIDGGTKVAAPPAGSPAPTGLPRFEPNSAIADGYFRSMEPAPIPLREEGRLYVRVFMSSMCAADVLPGPVLARTGDLLLIPFGARQLSLRSPCGGLAEVYWGKEATPRVSEVFGRNQPLHLQFKPQ